MNFRSTFKQTKSNVTINHQDKLLLVGSCFAKNIGKKLINAKFEAINNPMGIAFNPISLHKLLAYSSSEVDDLVPSEQQGIYFHPDLHSEFNTTEQSLFNKQVKQQIEVQDKQLLTKPTVFITYGTSWVYSLISNGQLVNNCHKQAAANFSKRMLGIDEIVESWNQTHKLLLEKHQQEFNFIFTISPVRHLKGGFHENQLSKSTLLLAVNEICKQHTNCSYFPAYELMMDDLRDYRFYESDLVHPNQQAIDYIWETFQSVYFDEQTIDLTKQAEKIQRAISHKPFHVNSIAHQNFLKQTLLELKKMNAENNLNLKQEIHNLEKQIN